jgi:hypothetical protein
VPGRRRNGLLAIGSAAEAEEFLSSTRRFLVANVTDEVLLHARETGDGFVEKIHLAVGARGWLEQEAKSARDGGSPQSSAGSGIWSGDARGSRW